MKKSETEIPITKASASPSIKINHFLLAWASTVHKVQSLSLDQGVVDFDSKKQKSFGPGQTYTALSRVKPNDKLFCKRKYKRSPIKLNMDTLN